MDGNELKEQAIAAWIRRGYERVDIIDRWVRRVMPFDNCEEDTEERPQLMPFPPPPVKDQTEPWARGDNGS